MTTRKKHRYILFTLSMPSNNSWNGRWSGQEKVYCVSRRFAASEAGHAAADRILSHDGYSHSFGDGWRAHVSVREVDAKERAKALRKSCGFCDYDWMVDSILDHGAIYNSPPSPVVAV